jgi:pimeloyl-ACP methyl ester carboxylesterase
MKTRTITLIIVLCVTMASKAINYVMLNPLDTPLLPNISNKDCGGKIMRKALDSDKTWYHTHKMLKRDHFSEKSVYKLMIQLYRSTHKHYVTFPIAYWSHTPQGDSLMVSGRVYLPKTRVLKGIVVANHYTMTSDIEVPSNMVAIESIFVMKGYAVIMPDYVGYGISRDKLHPYLHWRNAAQTAVDLLNCMPELLDYYGYSYPKDVIVTGYSQGGAVALGVARMIEENDNQEGDWSVRKLYAGAGPYDPAGTYLFSIERNEMGIPAAIPLIVMGLNDAYDLGFTPDEFFVEPLLSNYEDWIVSKAYTVGQINQLMGSTIMSELMTEEALDLDSPQADKLHEVLGWNSNVGYDLQASSYFLHSLEDEVVPMLNSIHLKEQMPEKENKTFDFDYYGSHMEASIPFIKNVYQDL